MSRLDHPVPRIVLDTNVCLDLFVFDDSLCSHVLAALRSGAVQAVTRDDCREEWQRVLHYPQLPIDDRQRPGLRDAFDKLIQLLPPEASTLGEDDLPLPRCADPDDQKFLELALASGARWLLSKDKELLKLDRRTRSAGLFAIRLPQLWSIAEVRSHGILRPG
ncbi:putative toxin-antitoxin system toxin component, PIN family [Rhodanobacter sp. C03]|uniref:putative toxin-antitoxin system toxin component, PIN family n=1 Tax=Rhodanobacter sp. C03 TaxID=1945858 RepID=UPI0009857D08|nr:putative toxin-antitoxin system toxin component, PIN family [Rhodanobacter sp. C03]OOG55477.1 putative toxin-antitoxin system toxin component, PIN family [Rhodanobacter sp. C03]